jgi:MFS family permease
MSSAVPREPLFTPRFAGLWAFTFVTFFSAFQLLPVIPLRILELGGTKAEAGWFLTVYTLCSAFAAPVMGNIADHVGRRRTLVTASLVFILFSVAYGVILDRRLLLLVGAVHGAIWSAILASSSAMMSEYVPESRRTEGMAYWGLASNAAVAIAPAVGLLVYHYYGWLALCLELAVLSVLMAIAGTRLASSDRPVMESRPGLTDAWDWRVTVTALSLAVVSFGYGGVTSYVAIFSMERGIHPASLFFSVFAITIVVVRITTSHLGDRHGAKVLLYPAMAAMPISFALLAAAHSRWQLVGAGILFGAGFGSMYPAFVSFILRTTDPARRARTFGSIVWAFDTGIGIGSAAIGTLGERYGLGNAFLFAAGISCLSIPIFAFTSRRF